MTWWLWLLRLTGLLGVIAAMADPGCARAGRPRLVAELVGDLPADVRASEQRRLEAAMPWADLVVAAGPDVRPPRDQRIVVGDAAPVLAALRHRPALAALALASPSLTIEAIAAPVHVLEGSRVGIQVDVGDIPERDTRRVRVRIIDAATGVEQGSAESVAGTASWERVLRLTVPWLATAPGTRRLRLTAEIDGVPAVRPSAPADVTIQVDPAQFSVEVLEARPTWAARFARLALAASGEVPVTARVRAAPGFVVRTMPAVRAIVKEPAQVLMVGGLDALAAGDVADIERQVSDAGSVAILLMDEAPKDGPWRRLWPGGGGRMRTAAAPRNATVAGARWRTKEWLVPTTSTAARPLAYLDNESEPIVVARALGAGRVVLVTALDAWRWRADEGVDWAGGWQALVRRLAADVPTAVTTTTWLTGSGRDRVVQVEVRARPDVVATGAVVVETVIATPGRVDVLALQRVDRGRWRGAMRVQTAAPHRVSTTVRTRRGVAGRNDAVVDVSAPALTAAWTDVIGHQQARGMFVVPAVGRAPFGADLAPTLEARWHDALAEVRQALVSPNGSRSYMTRRSWFAALVLIALGSEWILRRVKRLA